MATELTNEQFLALYDNLVTEMESLQAQGDAKSALQCSTTALKMFIKYYQANKSNMSAETIKEFERALADSVETGKELLQALKNEEVSRLNKLLD